MASRGAVDVFPAVVFGAVGRPMRGFEGCAPSAAVRGADQLAVEPHHGLRVLWDGPFTALCPTPPLLCQLQLVFLLLLGLLVPLSVRPIRGAHELGPLILGIPVVLVLLAGHRPQWLPLVVYALLNWGTLAPLTLFSPLTRPPHAHDHAEDPQGAEDHTQHGHQIIHWLGHEPCLHSDLNGGLHDGAVVALGESADDGAGRLLDPTVVRLLVLLEGNGHLNCILVGVGKLTKNQQRILLGKVPCGGQIPQLRAHVLHCCCYGQLVPVEDKCDVGTTVVQVARVGLTLAVDWWYRLRAGTEAPLVAGGRKAGQEVVLQALPTPWAGCTLSAWGSWQQARPSATHHLGALYFAVDALAGIAVFLPAAAMRELQSGVMTRFPNAYKLLASRPRASERTNAAEAVDLIYTRGSISTGR